MPWRRRPSRNIKRALNIADLREIARRRVPGFVFEYVEGGAEDEITLRGNREALEALRFVPRHWSTRRIGTNEPRCADVSRLLPC
jgi:(S)-mandelate dehydrogenase